MIHHPLSLGENEAGHMPEYLDTANLGEESPRDREIARLRKDNWRLRMLEPADSYEESPQETTSLTEAEILEQIRKLVCQASSQTTVVNATMDYPAL